MKEKKILLKLLAEAKKDYSLYRSDYQHNRIIRIARRMLRNSRGKYILDVISNKLGKGITIKSKTFFGGDFWLRLPDSVSQGIYNWGYIPGAEESLTAFLIKNLKKNDIFFDIGAYCGFYSTLAREIISNGEIHSFEPNSQIFPLLKKNVGEGKNIFINNMAIADVNKKINFYFTPLQNSISSSRKANIVYYGKNQRFIKKIRVSAITLNQYLLKHRQPTILKIDVEGGEDKVIQGGYNFFKTNKPIISLEFLKNNNTPHYQAVSRLNTLGYQIYAINKNGSIFKISISQIKNIIPKEYQYCNLILKK